MHQFTLEKAGQRRQPDVRMRWHLHALACRKRVWSKGIKQQERSDPTMLTMRQQAMHGEAIQLMAGTEDEKWHAKPDGMSGGCIIPVQDLDRCGRWLVAVRRLASDRRKVEKPIDRHAN